MPDAPEAFLRRLFDAAVAVAQPAICVPPNLPKTPSGRTVVVGAGKAAAHMARTVEKHWQGEVSGLVVTRYGHAVPCERIEIAEAAHPVPDAAGAAAARRMLDLVSDLGPGDLVLALISGGGSALLTLPAPGLTLADKQAVNEALLASGAPIQDMNCVRKHLSAIKGGRLARAAAPARVEALIISDVVGDDPGTIASGPTVGDATTFADARAVLEKHRVAVPDAVRRHLAAAGDESPKPGDPCFDNARATVIASAGVALAAAAEVAKAEGYAVHMLGEDVEGEARDVARAHAALALETATGTVILSGGELTVTLGGGARGKGGPNTEYALALATALAGAPGIHLLAADTDGADGSGGNAGAFAGPATLAAGPDPAPHLQAHDSYGFFEAAGGLLHTGPTGTNVNDFRAILVDR